MVIFLNKGLYYEVLEDIDYTLPLTGRALHLCRVHFDSAYSSTDSCSDSDPLSSISLPSQFLAASCVDNTNSDSYLVIARMRRTSMALNTIFGITNFRLAIFLYLYYRRHPDAELEVLG